MASEIIRIEGDLISARISGTLRLADQNAFQRQAAQLIAKGRKLRLLAVLDGFQGWEKGVDWSDVDFLVTHGNDIVKMAFVGEECWKEQLFAFVGKGLRKTEIEFFPSGRLKEAETWVRS